MVWLIGKHKYAELSFIWNDWLLNVSTILTLIISNCRTVIAVLFIIGEAESKTKIYEQTEKCLNSILNSAVPVISAVTYTTMLVPFGVAIIRSVFGSYQMDACNLPEPVPVM